MSEPSFSDIVGLDIGGANLKYVSSRGVAFSRRFELWRHPQELADTITADLCERFEPHRMLLAVTMTGELADCFVDRSEGVDHIVDQVSKAATCTGVKTLRFYGVDGNFRSASRARDEADLVAAANWHALASFVGREIASDATLIDIGSTTTDIIEIRSGQVAIEATTDYQRLQQGSLVYVGCRRTPVCALVDRICFRGRQSEIMNEHFATIDDARIVLGFERQRGDDNDSADGKPRTREMAANRLARMIGLDRRHVSPDDAKEIAAQVHVAAKKRIADSIALRKRIGDDSLIVLSGHGDDLVEFPAHKKLLRLADRLGPEISRCAPSHAVAHLIQFSNSPRLQAFIDPCDE